MFVNVWKDSDGARYVSALQEIAFRAVELEDRISTRKLVDTSDEQIILNDLIDATRPLLSYSLSQAHRLLYAPFKIPPLKYGSRFGTSLQHSIWYGSANKLTCLSEVAFYKFNFIRASQANFGNIETNHTIFSVSIKTQKGVDLTKRPFQKYSELISSPVSYNVSQALGKAMREAKVEVICYQSARCPKKLKNIAVFTPAIFYGKKPHQKSFEHWRAIANEKLIDFIRLDADENENAAFHLQDFLVDGTLPFPAQ